MTLSFFTVNILRGRAPCSLQPARPPLLLPTAPLKGSPRRHCSLSQQPPGKVGAQPAGPRWGERPWARDRHFNQNVASQVGAAAALLSHYLPAGPAGHRGGAAGGFGGRGVCVCVWCWGVARGAKGTSELLPWPGTPPLTSASWFYSTCVLWNWLLEL